MTSLGSGPLVVSAELGGADFAWLDALRRAHYPPERNRVPAHLTMFRSLPPSAEAEVRRALARACSLRPPQAAIVGPMDLGQGVALQVRSGELDELREALAGNFHGLLTAQDCGGWIAHVTIQNKVDRPAARRLLRALAVQVEPRPLAIRGLLLWRYDGGQLLPRGRYRFRS